MPKGDKLDALSWDEVSGVDHPAHKEEGWMVMKAEELEAAIDAVLKEAADLETGSDPARQREDLANAVKAALGDGGYLAEADEKVRAAAAMLLDPTRKDAPPVIPATIEEALPVLPEGLRKEIEDLRARAEKAEPPAGETEEERTRKALESLPEPLRDRFAKAEQDASDARTRAEEAERVAKAERDGRLDAEVVDHFRTLKNLAGIKPEEFGPMFRRLKAGELTAEEAAGFADRIEQALVSANAVVSEHDVLLSTIGKSATGEGTAYAKLQQMARDRVSKGLSKTEEIAMAEVTETPEGKELAKRYEQEREEAIR